MISGSSFQSRPYEITVNRNGLRFITDHNLVYEIYFAQAENHFKGTSFAHQTFQFGFLLKSKSYQQNQEKQSRLKSDPRIMATVIDQIDNWFYDFPISVLAFVCSMEEDRHLSRLKLFEDYYRAYRSEISEEYIMLKSASEEEGLVGGFIFRKGNPYEKDLIQFISSDLKSRFNSKDW